MEDSDDSDALRKTLRSILTSLGLRRWRGIPKNVVRTNVPVGGAQGAMSCRICGDPVAVDELRDHLVLHNPNARGMEWEAIRATFMEFDGRSCNWEEDEPCSNDKENP